MAGQAPCNSFLLTPPPHSRLVLKSPKFAVFGKTGTSSSGVQKSTRDSSPESGTGNNAKSNPFQFNWGNLSSVSSLIPVVSSPPALTRRKDAGTVFVAGATGQVGVRIAQMLLRQGFRVRAGVPDLGAAQDLARFASDYKIISTEESKRLNAVESMFDDAELIAKAIGSASKVVVTIGSTENGPTKGVTTSDALQVVEAAQLAGVGHVTIIYDESASSAMANSALNSISSFFNNLFSRSQSLTVAELLEKVVETDVRYTFIKTALTDDFSPESSYNVVVAAEGSAGSNDSKSNVPRSQMASMVANLFSNTEIAENKVVEIYTDSSAPLKSLDELFSAIPEDGRRKAYTDALATAKAEEEATKAAEQARAAEEAARMRLEKEAQAASRAEEAKQKAKEAAASVDSFLNKAKDLSAGFSWDKIGSQLKTPDFEIPKVQLATVTGQVKAQNLPSKEAVVKQPTSKSRPKPRPKSEPKPSPVARETEEKPKAQPKEVRNILGGLFKQETIYVDDE